MPDDYAILMSANGEVQVDLAVGNISRLVLRDRGERLEPLYRAPWADAPYGSFDHLPPVERRLSGDFLCAPYGENTPANLPLHGPAANGRWRHVTRSYSDWVTHPAMVMELNEQVLGATLAKEIALGTDAPILYQSHRVTGGAGTLPIATHPLVGVAPGNRVTLSPKMRASTAPKPPVRGNHLLSYPAATEDLSSFPGPGGPVDLGRIPEFADTEDLVQLVEAPGRSLGWTAVTRAEDVVFVLKDPATLPVTQLWLANGARHDPPWNRATGAVLAIQDARVPTDQASMPRGLDLGVNRTHVINHAVGTIRRPAGWSHVAAIDIRDDLLLLTGDDGSSVEMPFESEFF